MAFPARRREQLRLLMHGVSDAIAYNEPVFSQRTRIRFLWIHAKMQIQENIESRKWR